MVNKIKMYFKTLMVEDWCGVVVRAFVHIIIFKCKLNKKKLNPLKFD